MCVLCRITSGPFNGTCVISSSLTLEDPDLKVRESTNPFLCPLIWAVKLESDPALCDKKRHSKHQKIYWGDMTCSCYVGISFFLCRPFCPLPHEKQGEEKEDMCCDCPGMYWCGCEQKALVWGVCEKWVCDMMCGCDVECVCMYSFHVAWLHFWKASGSVWCKLCAKYKQGSAMSICAGW